MCHLTHKKVKWKKKWFYSEAINEDNLSGVHSKQEKWVVNRKSHILLKTFFWGVAQQIKTHKFVCESTEYVASYNIDSAAS